MVVLVVMMEVEDTNEDANDYPHVAVMQYCTKYIYNFYPGGGAENSWWGASSGKREAEGRGKLKIIIIVVP